MQLRFTQSMKIIAGSLLFAFIFQQTADQFFGQSLASLFSLNGIHSETFNVPIFQIMTYPLIHQDPLTLCFNVLGILFFGVEMEILWGPRLFWAFIGFANFGIALLFLCASLFFDLPPLQGSSGLFYAFLSAYAILFGERSFLLLGAFPMKTRQFIGLLILIATLSVLFSPQGRGTGLVHLGGVCMGAISLAGVFFLKKGQRPTKKRRGSLKLVVNKRESSDDDSDPKKPTWH
jgi:membrane associated rhomboid family serine protease